MTDAAEADRRRSRRVALPDTHGSLVVSLDGHILDISVAGMAIETHSRLSPHHRISLRIAKGAELLHLEGRVVWCFLQGTRAAENGETLPVYRAGIEFSGVLADGARDLLSFLESHAIVTLETRIFGRFRIEESSVAVSTTADFEVRAINLHGMAVETRLLLEPGAVCHVELRLPERTLMCQARVVSSRVLVPGRDLFEVAVEYLDLTDEDGELLREVLRRELASGVARPV